MPIHDWSRVMDSGLFHHFHNAWGLSLCQSLNSGILPKDYEALTEQNADGPIPDLLTLRKSRPDSTASGTTATLPAPPKTLFVQRAEPEIYAARAKRVVVRHRLGEIVAVVEIVSPGNKSSKRALNTFVDKAVDYLRKGIHLLVLDPFPPSIRDPQGIHGEIWEEIQDGDFELPKGKPLTLASYDAGVPIVAYVEPAAVGSSLPEMPLFLEPERYVSVPLEAAYEMAWNFCPPSMREAVIGLETS